MNRIEDERILFYLRHQQRIDEWADLAKEAREMAHEFLRSCKPDVAALADQLGPDVQFFQSLEGAFPKLFLCRPAWFADKAGKSPRMGVGLEWCRSTVSFAVREKSAYVGVWVDNQMSQGAALQGAVSSEIRKAGLLKRHVLEEAEWWPAYRYEPAEQSLWKNLGAYRDQLLESIRFFWTTFEPIVRQLGRA
jgi:hypothetical protein